MEVMQIFIFKRCSVVLDRFNECLDNEIQAECLRGSSPKPNIFLGAKINLFIFKRYGETTCIVRDSTWT